MVKRGTLLSAFLVLTLLILLAPAVVLTGQNVAQGQVCNNTQQIEASFNFTQEADPDPWESFTAGGAGIDPEGLYLAQFTRDGDTIAQGGDAVSDCEFRNYTTGSGTVSGTGLNGVASMDLMWITWKFGKQYPGTPKYYTGNRFGTMMGRGHIDEGEGDNFTFVFILDYDSNSDMSAAGGKGYMVSTEENGRFGNMADPPELRHKIIGDFGINKTGANYTGEFHLRNYDPSEVFNLSYLNVTGAVVQEVTDPIRFGLELLNFTQDGPKSTPLTQATGFEEVAWGKDPAKTVTSGHLGPNGDMIVIRNTALYLGLNEPEFGYVHIMGTTANNIYIDDRDTGPRAGDGTKYGELWELLLLFIPDQTLPVGELFWQSGYTFTPFYMPNDNTGVYVGSENFALADIAIESSLEDAQQYSVDISYGLYPHPKVDNVTPGNGMPNTTMDVTISGKYFLRAAGEKSGGTPNTGNVSFGPNITVNSYTINGNDPIDNTITASITISPTAGAGVEVVNVTSCFGYSNGNGTDPYLSGLGEFTVSGETGTLQGHVDLKRKAGASWVTGLVVSFFDPGTNFEAGFSPKYATTDENGNFTVTGVGVGTWDVGVKNWTCLSRMSCGEDFTIGNITTINFVGGNLVESDTDNDDRIKLIDFNRILNNFGAQPGDGGWDPNYDFDRSGKVDLVDFNLVLNNFGEDGDIYDYPPCP